MKPVANATVPCGSCQHCCKNLWIWLKPEEGDVVEQYDTVDYVSPITGLPAKALSHKPNGDCVYLGPAGCTIHGRHPAVCRAFDCRRFYLKLMALPRTERRREMRTGYLVKETLEVGRRMQEAYPVDEPSPPVRPAR